jgi:hypothetical protein
MMVAGILIKNPATILSANNARKRKVKTLRMPGYNDKHGRSNREMRKRSSNLQTPNPNNSIIFLHHFTTTV